MMPEEKGKLLLSLARESISCCFNNKNPDTGKVEKFSEKQGVFVTLHKNNELRGCIGFPEPIFPLYKAVVKAAIAAAFEDPRFPPLQKQEFKDIKIELSVLTVPELIKVENPEEYMEKIKIGKDGLIIRSGLGSGLLLPQVATEYKWNVKTFLEHLCQKAWLGKDAWKNPDNKIYNFQAQIFSE
jgi:hypothetical protein